MANRTSNKKWIRTGKTLGGGGQGQIFEVKPSDSVIYGDETYALKQLRNIESDQAIKRFVNEIEAIKKIDDERIVKIVDYSIDDPDDLYYVMPNYQHKDFVTLHSIVFENSSPFKGNPKRSLVFIKECALAINVCNINKVIHRDLKPQNILLNTKTLKPLILDFGCCQHVYGESITLIDEGVGTKDYMAPECESGSNSIPNEKSDVYSLGKILWVLITARQPFARENPAYTNLSLNKIFPNNPECWHLTRIFELSIRNNIDDRCDPISFSTLCDIFVRIIGRYPPLEDVRTVCPSCGIGDLVTELKNYRIPMHMIFSNPMPEGIRGYVCNKCGFICARDTRILDDYFKMLKKLD